MEQFVIWMISKFIGRSDEEHLENLNKVLQTIEENGMTLKSECSEFWQKRKPLTVGSFQNPGRNVPR